MHILCLIKIITNQKHFMVSVVHLVLLFSTNVHLYTYSMQCHLHVIIYTTASIGIHNILNTTNEDKIVPC